VKQKLAAIIAIVLVVVTISGCNGIPAERRIVCVGDSITAGSSDTNNWPYHLKERLGRDWGVFNHGVWGYKTADMLAHIDAALAFHPHFVIIMGGTNDLMKGVQLATIQANIVAMCTRVESHGAVPVLCTVIPTSWHLADLDTLNAWIADYAKLKGYDLIDFYAVIDNPLNPGTSNPALVRPDGVHPNAAGYSAMGNAIDLSIFTEALPHSSQLSIAASHN
jgi:acyl-CoA thioesterase I